MGGVATIRGLVGRFFGSGGVVLRVNVGNGNRVARVADHFGPHGGDVLVSCVFDGGCTMGIVVFFVYHQGRPSYVIITSIVSGRCTTIFDSFLFLCGLGGRV